MMTYCVHCRKPDDITHTDLDGCYCVTANCGHVIGPDTDDVPPCDDCGRCEACCPCVCELCGAPRRGRQECWTCYEDGIIDPT
jgi:hypothetical protein